MRPFEKPARLPDKMIGSKGQILYPWGPEGYKEEWEPKHIKAPKQDLRDPAEVTRIMLSTQKTLSPTRIPLSDVYDYCEAHGLFEGVLSYSEKESKVDGIARTYQAELAERARAGDVHAISLQDNASTNATILSITTPSKEEGRAVCAFCKREAEPYLDENGEERKGSFLGDIRGWVLTQGQGFFHSDCYEEKTQQDEAARYSDSGDEHNGGRVNVMKGTRFCGYREMHLAHEYTRAYGSKVYTFRCLGITY